MTKISSKIFILMLAVFLAGMLLHPVLFAQADNDEDGVVELEIQNLVRNLSRGDTRWFNAVTAEPSDLLLFRIKIESTGDVEAEDIMIRDILPQDVIYLGELRVNYGSREGNISTEAVNIGNLNPEGLRIVSFKAQVASANNFGVGQTVLINTVMVYNEEVSESDTCKVIVKKKAVAGAATDVDTGITDGILSSILLPLGIAILGVWIFRSKLIGLDKWTEGRKREIGEYRAKKTLKKKITQLRTKGYFKE